MPITARTARSCSAVRTSRCCARTVRDGKILVRKIPADGESYLQVGGGHGLDQGKAYAHSKRLNVPFVFSSNGHLFVEYDQAQRDGNHVHTVWRDLSLDFGGDPLADHYTGGSHPH